MSISGQIMPGASGAIYLTDALYRLGWHATDRLALPERNTEIAIAIPYADMPKDSVGSPAVEQLGIVQPVPGTPGRAHRRGGDHERIIRRPIPLRVGPLVE